MIYSYNEFLLEKRNFTNKIMKFANVPLVYNWANKTDKNLALWIAGQLVKNLISYIEKKNKDDLKFLNDYLKGIKINKKHSDYFDKTIKSIQKSIEQDIKKVLDYVNSPLHLNRPKLKNIDIKDAVILSDEWHEKLKDSKYLIEDEEGEILKTYDNDFYWIDLNSSSCPDEAKAMGHCGTTSQGTTMLSLRRYKQPHVTIGYDEDKNNFTQIKGKGNDKPISKYHKYIVDLICKLNINRLKSEYDRSTDFDTEDLDDKLLSKLKKCNPDYIKKSVGLTLDQLEDKFRNSLRYDRYDDWMEYAENMGNRIWYYVDDKQFISNYLEDEIGNRVTDFSNYYQPDDIVSWIEMNISNDTLKKYFNKLFDREIKNLEQYEYSQEDLKYEIEEIEKTRKKDITELLKGLDIDELKNLLDDIDKLYNLVQKDLENQYNSAEDVYSSTYGNPDNVDYEFIRNYLIDYIDQEAFINMLVNDAEEDWLRERFDE